MYIFTKEEYHTFMGIQYSNNSKLFNNLKKFSIEPWVIECFILLLHNINVNCVFELHLWKSHHIDSFIFTKNLLKNSKFRSWHTLCLKCWKTRPSQKCHWQINLCQNSDLKTYLCANANKWIFMYLLVVPYLHRLERISGF